MNIDERIRFLLDAAHRAEREGAYRIARVLRSMAEDARPLPVTCPVGSAGARSRP